MTWLRAHWKPLAWYAALAGASFAAGYLTHRPQPAVQFDSNAEARRAFEGASETTAETGPKRTTVDETTYDAWASTTPAPQPDCPARQLVPVPMPGPVRTVRHTVIEEGAGVVRTVVAERMQEEAQEHIALTVTPAPPPRWALGAGLEDLLGSRRVTLTAGMRLLGPVWLRAGLAPARGLGGVTVGAEVTW